ncbi:hypothetical protein F2Q68_00037699 [Brassica cretica]|uniref:TF-B3 domain-containing protein n=1 Tax=Brassica cretica TaxID=69181 RepID=A0A8S9H141_BRACR|nr:hypothetical protein F2Q68_00037699 [Brassica cretica]
MVNATLLSPATPHFFQPLLSHSKSHLNIPAKFFSGHIEGKQEGKTVTLRSDASEKTWKVEMKGQRLTQGWKEFVEAHALRVGDFVVFRLERDMLFNVTALGSSYCEIRYTPSGSRRQEGEEEIVETEKEVEKNLTRFVTLTPTSSSFETGKQRLPANFTRGNGLIKPGKIIMVDKKGDEWVMELKVEKTNVSIMYMYIMSRNGWRIFCDVNEMEQTPFEAEARAHKRAKWSQEIREKTTEEGEPSHRARASNKTNANQENLQNKQPCSVSDLLTEVKHSVVSTLTSIRQCREELKTKEQELEDSLQEINNLVSMLQYLPSKFARANGLNNRQCEIDLRNEHGKSWTLDLTHHKSTGQAFVRNGWTSFCKANGIKAESFRRFKLVQTGTKPVLQLCPNTEGDDEIESEDCSEPSSMNQNRIVALELKPYMFKSGRVRVPASFGRANGIKEAGKISIVNKDGVEWKLHLGNMKGREQFYIRGLRNCFVANGIEKVGDPFTLEAIRGGTNPILKFNSKTPEKRQPRMIQMSRAKEEKETRVEKKARVSAEGGPSHRTRASNRTIAGTSNLQHKQPIQPCSISDQVTKVKQSVVDALTDVRQFRSELEVKERNLEAALLEIDMLEIAHPLSNTCHPVKRKVLFLCNPRARKKKVMSLEKKLLEYGEKLVDPQPVVELLELFDVVKDSNHNSFHSVSSGVHSDHISEPLDDKTIVGVDSGRYIMQRVSMYLSEVEQEPSSSIENAVSSLKQALGSPSNQSIFRYGKDIMSLVLQESDDIPPELLSPILHYVQKENRLTPLTGSVPEPGDLSVTHQSAKARQRIVDTLTSADNLEASLHEFEVLGEMIFGTHGQV